MTAESEWLRLIVSIFIEFIYNSRKYDSMEQLFGINNELNIGIVHLSMKYRIDCVGGEMRRKIL